MLVVQILVFILGLSIGSFLNACIFSIPDKKAIIFPVTQCPNCKQRLSAIDWIPLLGYIVNKGKCKHCGTKVSIKYPIVELLTGIILLLLYNKFFISMEFIKYAVLSCLLIVITFVDLERQEIPDELILFGLIMGLLFNIFNIKTDMVPGIIGFILGGGAFLIIAMLTNGAMGGGDIKLMAVLGLFLGWKLIIIVAVISFILGGVVSFILITAKIKGRKDYIPFGPFIALAALAVIFYGIRMIQTYMSSIPI